MVPLEISMGNFRYVILQHFGYHNKKRVFGGIRGLFCLLLSKSKNRSGRVLSFLFWWYDFRHRVAANVFINRFFVWILGMFCL